MIGSVSWTRAMPLKSSRSARPLLARRFELFAGVINGARSQLREQFVLARPGPSGQAGRGRAKGEAEGETRSAEGRRRREGAGAYMRLRRPGGASLPRAEPQRATKHGGRHRHGEWTPRKPGACTPWSLQSVFTPSLSVADAPPRPAAALQLTTRTSRSGLGVSRNQTSSLILQKGISEDLHQEQRLCYVGPSTWYNHVQKFIQPKNS